MTRKKKSKRGTNKIWIVPVVLIAIMALGIAGYYGYSIYQQQQEASESSESEASVKAELDAMRRVLDKEAFYDGIFIDDINLAGMTYTQAKSELEARDSAWRDQFLLTLTLDSDYYQLTQEDISLTSDWQAVLDQAWQTGRTSDKTGEAEQVRDRYAVVTGLAAAPLHLSVSETYDETALRTAVLALAESLRIEPVNATAVGFDLASKTFTLSEALSGRIINGEACLAEVLNKLASGDQAPTVALQALAVAPTIGMAEMQAKLGLVSEAYTIAVNDANRNNNIRLVCEALNGHVIQPGETFSYNGVVGKRTPEKGYKEAGTISDGVLTPAIGGGVCQPSTTLCQAVLKADLLIAERYPHSWPSSYTTPGLDATVNYGGADFKFTNNTEYPVAIVSSFVKQKVLFKIYGRKLDDGVSIVLDTEITEKIPNTLEPTERYNPELAPGERLEVRHEYTGLRITAFKVWKKDGLVIKKEIAFTSYYRPLNVIIEYGPPAPTPTPTSSPTPLESTTEGTTPEETTTAAP
jgi:vancomycin resistance protein YoaR